MVQIQTLSRTHVSDTYGIGWEGPTPKEWTVTEYDATISFPIKAPADSDPIRRESEDSARFAGGGCQHGRLDASTPHWVAPCNHGRQRSTKTMQYNDRIAATDKSDRAKDSRDYDTAGGTSEETRWVKVKTQMTPTIGRSKPVVDASQNL